MSKSEELLNLVQDQEKTIEIEEGLKQIKKYFDLLKREIKAFRDAGTSDQMIRHELKQMGFGKMSINMFLKGT